MLTDSLVSAIIANWISLSFVGHIFDASSLGPLEASVWCFKAFWQGCGPLYK